MELAIVGGGPAGLRAAEVASAAGAVTLFDAKPSVGRKFLVAGRGGLNLTHAEDPAPFAGRYHGTDMPANVWRRLLSEFDADGMRAWAASLGIETFAASTGRVYPREMKAAPLLRRWVQRLRENGVRFAMHHRITALSSLPSGRVRLSFFISDSEPREVEVDAVILALGGGSWPETGSDGKWCELLAASRVAVIPLGPANCGWEVAWPAKVLEIAEGQPLKNVEVRAGDDRALGELLITSYGLEGGAIYQLAPALRAMRQPAVTIDFKPGTNVAQLLAKLGTPRIRPLLAARDRWNLSDAVMALLEHHPVADELDSPEALAKLVKAYPLTLLRPRPLSEAISTAGGVRWSELDEHLMIRRLPGVFVAGEMIDWEAPTGGYLLQGCFATGTHAANSAVAWIARRAS